MEYFHRNQATPHPRSDNVTLIQYDIPVNMPI